MEIETAEDWVAFSIEKDILEVEVGSLQEETIVL